MQVPTLLNILSGTKLKWSIGVSHPLPHNLENLPFCRAKRYYNVFLQGSLLDQGALVYYYYKKDHRHKSLCKATSDTPPKNIEVPSLSMML